MPGPGPEALREPAWGTIGGVTPNMMVVGLCTGEFWRGNGPCLRERTADSNAGYHADEEAASVAKSRTYMIRGGRGIDAAESSEIGACMLIIWSKNVFTLSIELTGALERAMTALPPLERDAGASTCKVIDDGG